MQGRSSNARTVVTGAVLGAVVPGLGGRLATAVLAAALGVPANLSAVGLAEATLVGSIWGVVGATVLLAIDRSGFARLPRGVAAGAAPFVGSAMLAVAVGHGPDLGRAEGWATTLTAAAVFLLFGLALARAVPVRRPR
jgi:hypothetical protein